MWFAWQDLWKRLFWPVVIQLLETAWYCTIAATIVRVWFW